LSPYKALMWIALLSLLGLILGELVCRWIVWWAAKPAREARRMKIGIMCPYCKHGELQLAQSDYNDEIILSCDHCDVVKRYNFKEINKIGQGKKPKNDKHN